MLSSQRVRHFLEKGGLTADPLGTQCGHTYNGYKSYTKDCYICYSMNSNIRKIFDIVNQPERLIIGLMSGTSLDGLDIALCKISGNGAATKVSVLAFKTTPYSNEFKKMCTCILLLSSECTSIFFSLCFETSFDGRYRTS